MSSTITVENTTSVNANANRLDDSYIILHHIMPENMKVKPQREIKLSDREMIFCPDVSGSTGSGCPSILEEINKLINELRVLFENSYLAPWDHNSYPITQIIRDVNLNPCGGTDPEKRFNDDLQKKIHDKSAMIFITDGAVDQEAVTRMAKKMNMVSHLPIICVLITSNTINNFSVLAPFLIAKDVIIIHKITGHQHFRTLTSKGIFSIFDDSHINWDVCMNLKSIVSQNNEQTILSIDSEIGNIDIDTRLLNRLRVNDLPLIERSLMSITMYFVTNGLTDTWRNILNGLNSQVQSNTRPHISVGGDQIMQIRQLIRANEISPYQDQNQFIMELNTLRSELIELRQSTTTENTVEDDLYKKCRNLIQTELSRLHQLTTTGYKTDALRSNRAIRSVKDGMNNDDVEFTFDESDNMECPICMDMNIPCIVVKKVDFVSTGINTCDHAMNFPLAHGKGSHNQVIQPSWMCQQCADQYSVHPLTRNEMNVLSIPVVSLKNNMKPMYKRIADIFRNGANHPSGMMLLLSVLSHHVRTYEWCKELCDDEHGEHGEHDKHDEHDEDSDDIVTLNTVLIKLMTEILNNSTSTKDMFSTATVCNPRVKLRDAITAILGDKESFYRQPWNSSELIVWIADTFKLHCSTDSGRSLLGNRYIRHIIDNVLSISKRETNNLSKSTVNNILVDCLFSEQYHGVPQIHSARIPTIQYVAEKLQIDVLDISGDDVRVAVASTLSILLKINNTENLQQYSSKMLIDKIYNLNAFDSLIGFHKFWNLTLQDIMQLYDFDKPDGVHNEFPPLVPFGWWSSCVRCECGYHWDVNTLDSIKDRSIAAYNNRMNHFQHVYNTRETSAYTDYKTGKRSSSYNGLRNALEVFVREDVQQKYDTYSIEKFIEYVSELIIEKITSDNKGNIFLDLKNDSIQLTNMFIEQHKKLGTWPSNEMLFISFESKFEQEVRYYN